MVRLLVADIPQNIDYYAGCTCGDGGSHDYNAHTSRRAKILKMCVEPNDETVVTPTDNRREQQLTGTSREQDKRRRQRQRQRILQESEELRRVVGEQQPKLFLHAKKSSYVMVDVNTNSSNNPQEWNGHIKPGHWTLQDRPRNLGAGVEFKIIVNDGIHNDDEDQLPTSWRAVGTGFENHLNDTLQ